MRFAKGSGYGMQDFDVIKRKKHQKGGICLFLTGMEDVICLF